MQKKCFKGKLKDLYLLCKALALFASEGRQFFDM